MPTSRSGSSLPPFAFSFSLACSLLVACGGSQPRTTGAEATSPAPAPEAPAASGAGEAATEPSESGWDGEDEAIADGAADSAGGETETRSMSVIQKVVADNREKVRACYERALKDNPGLRGDMTIHFVLDPEGKVKKAELNVERSTLRAPDVVACAVEELKKMPFPPSSRGMETSVNYPFNLNP